MDRYELSVRGRSEEPPAGSEDGGPSVPGHGLMGGHPPVEGPVPPSVEDGEIAFGGMRLRIPDDWVPGQPRIGFILAEFTLPGSGGASGDGRLTVSRVGGGMEANVRRWRQQFDGGPEKESQETLDVAGTSIKVVDFSGTFQGDGGPFAAAPAQQSDYRVLGAVVPLEEELYFVKATGPAETMAEEVESFFAFLRSMEPIEPGAGASPPSSAPGESNHKPEGADPASAAAAICPAVAPEGGAGQDRPCCPATGTGDPAKAPAGTAEDEPATPAAEEGSSAP